MAYTTGTISPLGLGYRFNPLYSHNTLKQFSKSNFYTAWGYVGLSSYHFLGDRLCRPICYQTVVCWPDCKPEGPLFSAEFDCLSVCLSLAGTSTLQR